MSKPKRIVKRKCGHKWIPIKEYDRSYCELCGDTKKSTPQLKEEGEKVWNSLTEEEQMKAKNNERVFPQFPSPHATPQPPKESGLFSDCCRADFDPFGFERPDGLWQEKCLQCGKPCEPIWYEGEEQVKMHKPESWEDEFVEKCAYWSLGDTLRFIRTLLQTQKELTIRELREQNKLDVEKERKLERRRIIGEIEKKGIKGMKQKEKSHKEKWLAPDFEIPIYNQAIDDILKLIKERKRTC